MEATEGAKPTNGGPQTVNTTKKIDSFSKLMEEIEVAKEREEGTEESRRILTTPAPTTRLDMPETRLDDMPDVDWRDPEWMRGNPKKATDDTIKEKKLRSRIEQLQEFIETDQSQMEEQDSGEAKRAREYLEKQKMIDQMNVLKLGNIRFSNPSNISNNWKPVSGFKEMRGQKSSDDFWQRSSEDLNTQESKSGQESRRKESMMYDREKVRRPKDVTNHVDDDSDEESVWTKVKEKKVPMGEGSFKKSLEKAKPSSSTTKKRKSEHAIVESRPTKVRKSRKGQDHKRDRSDDIEIDESVSSEEEPFLMTNKALNQQVKLAVAAEMKRERKKLKAGRVKIVKKKFEALSESSLTMSKLVEFFDACDAQLVSDEVTSEKRKKDFVFDHVSGRTLKCCNKYKAKRFTYDQLVEGVLNDRLGPVREGVKGFNGEPENAMNFWEEKVNHLKRKMPGVKNVMILDEIVKALGLWEGAKAMRFKVAEIDLMPGEDLSEEEMNKLKNYFIRIVSLIKSEERKEKGIMMIEKGREGGQRFGDEKKPKSTCRNCKKEGHFARECPEEQKCWSCGEEGHKSTQCTKRDDSYQTRDKKGGKREIGGRYERSNDRRDDRRGDRRDDRRNDRRDDRRDDRGGGGERLPDQKAPMPQYSPLFATQMQMPMIPSAYNGMGWGWPSFPQMMQPPQGGEPKMLGAAVKYVKEEKQQNFDLSINNLEKRTPRREVKELLNEVKDEVKFLEENQLDLECEVLENNLNKIWLSENLSSCESILPIADDADSANSKKLKSKKTKIGVIPNSIAKRNGKFRVSPIKRLDPKQGPKKKPTGGEIQPYSKKSFNLKTLEVENLQNIIGKIPKEEEFTIEELIEENEKAELVEEEKEEIEMINNISDVPKGNLCLPGILKVEASVQNQKIPILLDTGAKANCIDFKCVEAMSGVKMKSTNRNLVGANNSNLNVKGCVTLNVSFEGDMICYEEDDEDQCEAEKESVYTWRKIEKLRRQKVWKESKGTYQVEFIVVQNLLTQVLIGFPTLEEMGMIINTREATVAVGNKEHEIVMSYKGKKEEYVFAVEDMYIQPNCMDQVLKIDVKKIEERKEMVFVIKDIFNQPGLAIEDGIIDQNCETVKITNHTSTKYFVPKGLPLGVLRKAIWKEEEVEGNSDVIFTVEEKITVTESNEKLEKDEKKSKEVDQEEREFREDRKKALSGKGITAEGKRKIKKVLEENKSSFKRKVKFNESTKQLEPYHLRMQEGAHHVIEAMNRQNPERNQIEENLAQDLADRGLIEEGKGACRSRVLLVKKSDGTWRTVIDYRKINAQMIPDSYPMPRIDDMLDNLSGAKYFSKLDMTDGFWQIGLDEKSREWTGFATRSKFWRWKVLPMGIMNSPSAFQRAMDQVLGALKWKCVMCYVDDLIIYSNTLEEHVEHIRQVLEKLSTFGVFVKLAKCQFGVEELKFLGHIVGKDGMRPDPEKTRAVNEMPRPSDDKAVSRFLGMAGFYRKYIQNFASRTVNLRKLMKKDQEFKWDDDCEKELKDIKKALTSHPVMAYPDFSKKFILSTDASYKGLGATLSQMGEGGERVIAYASRSVNIHEKKYGVTKIEALGVVWATNLFKVYLQDHKFDLVTDHKALLKFKELKDTNPTLERWSIKLSQYDFDIFYREGKKHVTPDCLSRDCINVIEKESDEIIGSGKNVNQQKEDIVSQQKEDGNLRGIYEQIMLKGVCVFDDDEEIQERELRNPRAMDSMVIKKDMRMYKRSYRTKSPSDRLCIPDSMKAEVLSLAHNTNHYSTKKTYNELKDSKVWWDGMHKDCDVYCKSCHVCARRNLPSGNRKAMQKAMEVSRKFELIGIDLTTPGPVSLKGNKHVLVVTDYATKWCKAIPIKDKEAMTVAEALWEEWICTFGPPERIISDNGGEFTADEFCETLVKVSQVKRQLTTPYNPRANGQVERFNKTLMNVLAKYTKENQQTWDEYLNTVCLDYNMARHSMTGETPYVLVYGQKPVKTIDQLVAAQEGEEPFNVEKWHKEGIPTMLERIRLAQKSRKKKQMLHLKKVNKNKVNLIYKEGEKVWVRFEPRTESEKLDHKKLKLPWYGPFEIGKVDTEKYGNTYQVKGVQNGEEVRSTINIKNLKRYVVRPEWMITKDDWNDDCDEMKETHEKEDDTSGNFGMIPEEISSEDELESTYKGITQKRILGSTRTWVKKVGDLIDVRFRQKKKNDYISVWACGTITKVDENNKERVYIEFLEGHDHDWYDKKENPEIEWRRCEETEKHKRSEKLSINLIPEKETRLERKRRRLAVRWKVSDDPTHLKRLKGTERKEEGLIPHSSWVSWNCRDAYKEDGCTSCDASQESEQKDFLTKEGSTRRRLNTGVSLTLSIRETPMEIRGSAKEVGEVMRNWFEPDGL